MKGKGTKSAVNSAMAVASGPKIVRPTYTCLVRKVQKFWPSQKLMNLECRLRVRNPARRQIGASSKVDKNDRTCCHCREIFIFLTWTTAPNAYKYRKSCPCPLSSQNMSFCWTPRCLRGAIPEYYGYMNYYQLLPCFVCRILCVHSCVTHLLTNKAVLMELPHPSHPSHLVSGKHSSSIPHSCSPIDGLVHPNSWPFTPSSFLSLLQSPKLSFWHNWFLITVLFTIWHQKIVKGQLKAPSFSACTSTWTCPFPNRTISMPEPGSQKHQFYEMFMRSLPLLAS